MLVVMEYGVFPEVGAHEYIYVFLLHYFKKMLEVEEVGFPEEILDKVQDSGKLDVASIQEGFQAVSSFP